jgi:hypothetical protein
MATNVIEKLSLGSPIYVSDLKPNLICDIYVHLLIIIIIIITIINNNFFFMGNLKRYAYPQIYLCDIYVYIVFKLYWI